MNRKGFTLIELMGVIVILSIIMLIAIPNVTSTLEKTKKDAYIADAKKFVSLVQYELRTGNIEKPTPSNYVIVHLGDLKTDQISKDPDGNLYDTEKSFVFMQVIDGYINYYVSLIVDTGDCNAARGIGNVNYENLDGDTRYDAYSDRLNICGKN